MLFEYIDFLWDEYVLCPVEDLGETGKMQRAAPGTNFGEQAANSRAELLDCICLYNVGIRRMSSAQSLPMAFLMSSFTPAKVGAGITICQMRVMRVVGSSAVACWAFNLSKAAFDQAGSLVAPISAVVNEVSVSPGSP